MECFRIYRKICCKYLRDKYADLKWGIAGRNGEKLEQVKADLGLDCDVLIADGGDLDDQESC